MQKHNKMSHTALPKYSACVCKSVQLFWYGTHFRKLQKKRLTNTTASQSEKKIQTSYSILRCWLTRRGLNLNIFIFAVLFLLIILHIQRICTKYFYFTSKCVFEFGKERAVHNTHSLRVAWAHIHILRRWKRCSFLSVVVFLITMRRSLWKKTMYMCDTYLIAISLSLEEFYWPILVCSKPLPFGLNWLILAVLFKESVCLCMVMGQYYLKKKTKIGTL